LGRCRDSTGATLTDEAEGKGRVQFSNVNKLTVVKATGE
jgi:hypothetical protein